MSTLADTPDLNFYFNANCTYFGQPEKKNGGIRKGEIVSETFHLGARSRHMVIAA